MGKGGDANIATSHGPIQLVGDKSEKFTWGEVKKHVSFDQVLMVGNDDHRLAGSSPNNLSFLLLPSLTLNLQLYCYLYRHALFRSHLRMHGSSTRTRSTTCRTGTSTLVAA